VWPADPLTQPSPARARAGPGGPGEQALRRRKPGAEPTSALYPGARPDTSRL
jgi:hypothetical protein